MKTCENKLWPSEWRKLRIVDIADVVSGGTPDTSNPGFWGGVINWITPSEITKSGKYIIRDTDKKITGLGLKNSSAQLLPPNSLIICTRATVGECSISTFPISTNQGFKNLIPKTGTTVDYLYYFFKSIKSRLVNLGSGSTFLEVSKKDIENLSLELPPLPEQKRIVAVLETWDRAIEKLAKKIEVKKQIKNGLMQNLLTGRVRIPGFNKEWQTVRLGNIATISRGGSPRPIESYLTQKSDGLNWLRIGDIEPGGKFITKTKERITKNGLNKTTQVHTGDFILSNSMSYGRPYIMKIDACIHDGWLALKNISESINKEYLYYLLLSTEIQSKFTALSAGSGVQNLKKETVQELNVEFPDISEQNAITCVLAASDEQISMLEHQLKRLKEQKSFLLENLITGKIRTPDNMEILNPSFAKATEMAQQVQDDINITRD